MAVFVRLFVNCLGIAMLVSAQATWAEQSRSIAQWTAIGADLSAQGHGVQAVVVLGNVVHAAPKYSPARTTLDRTLDALGPVARSDIFLRSAIRRDPQNAVAFQTALLRLDQIHPWRFSAQVGLLPTTNLGHSASAKYFVTDIGVFDISDGAQKKSGVGFAFGLHVDRYFHSTLGNRIRLRGSLFGNWYSVRRLRFLEPLMSLQYQALSGSNPWQVGLHAGYGFYDDPPGETSQDFTLVGTDAQKTFSLSNDRTITLSGSAQYRDYKEQPTLTGPDFSSGLSYGSRLSQKVYLRANVQLERSVPRAGYQRFSRLELSVGATRRLGDTLTGGVSLSGGMRIYDEDFPFLNYARRDHDAALTFSLKFDKLSVFHSAPQLNCTARRNDSNVALYSYHSFDCGLQLVSRF
ncbi:surface lipoprotein assembly modifier [Thioclava indica]|uniref:Surface lipoprotein assembly modifier C-terminal domain-containing protein n=1 Tax=Thioclava indica TaxID=1353528 RepID=A0A074JS85_9RHOB|nr:surface lipoprotein assembly modifier [Thioclava indica]KEO58493.1 hypothetical protein DT23_16450 [Thioclava indica]